MWISEIVSEYSTPVACRIERFASYFFKSTMIMNF